MLSIRDGDDQVQCESLLITNYINQSHNDSKQSGKPRKSSLYNYYSCSFIYFVISIYVFAIVVLMMALASSKQFRYNIYNFINQRSDEDLARGLIAIGIIELILIMVGFDIFIVDLIIGYLYPFIDGLLFVFGIKIIAKYGCFIVARYGLREMIFERMQDNIYFKTFYQASFYKPVEVLVLLQFITLPTFFKTYVAGVFEITHYQYLIVTSISNFLWTAFWIYLGKQSGNIPKYLDSGHTEDLVNLWVQAFFILSCISALIILGNYTRKIYNKLETDLMKQNNEQ